MSERDLSESERLALGKDSFVAVHGTGVADVSGAEGDGFAGHALRNLYQDVWARPHLPMREKRLVVLAILATQSLNYGLETHLKCALELGELTPEDVEELKYLLAGYLGFPKAVQFDQAWQKVLSADS